MTSQIAPGTLLPVATDVTMLRLAGRAGTQLQLIPNQRDHQYTWSPEIQDPHTQQRKILASDVDVQLMWLTAQKPINNAPLVYWSVNLGHGENVYGLPMLNSLGAAAPELFSTQFGGWLLPQRGLRLRLPARQLFFHFFVPPEAEPPPEPVVPGGAPCSIQISVQPCQGLEPHMLPLTDSLFAQNPQPGAPAQLPLGATEMRISDPTTGLPFAGAELVYFYDVTGSPANIGGTLMALFAEWRPIPVFAAFWSPDELAQVSFR